MLFENGIIYFICGLRVNQKIITIGIRFGKTLTGYLVDTGRKLNVHKTFRRRPGRLQNVLSTFNLRPVSTGYLHESLKNDLIE